MLKKIIYLLLFIVLNNTYANPLQTVAGDFYNGNQSAPYILSKLNAGRWHFANNISHLPSKMFELEIDKLSCAGETCVLVGQWKNNSYKQLPLLITTNNNGQSFNFITITAIQNLPKFEYALLSNVSCTATFCVAVGKFEKRGQDKASVLILTSQDKGTTWQYVNAVTGLPNKSQELNQVFCADKLCIAVGGTLILRSEDNGLTWATVNAIADLPEDFAYSHVRGLNCSKETCVMAGDYDVKHSDPNDTQIYEYPYLLVSNDLGKSWRMINQVDNKPLNTREAAFYAAQCIENGTICFAAGSYDDMKPNSLLFWKSMDNGKTWLSVKNIDDAQAIKKGGILDLSCSENICLAAGGNYHMPLLLVSHDNGISFTTIKQIQDLPNYTYLSQVRCNGENCYAVGEYKLKDDSNWLPLLLTSENSGNSWKLNTEVNNFPQDLTVGILTAA